MPFYSLICDGCGHAWDDVHAMRAAHPPCPCCGALSRVDFARQGAPAVPAHDLHGTRMLSHEVCAQPSEVPTLRRMYGEGCGHCWQDDGSVRFAHRDEGRKFWQKDEEIRRVSREKTRAQNEVAAAKT